MSELIKHECGVALIRLKQPLQYFEQKYGQVLWGFQKLFLLMEKQHNRGQDGAGIGVVKLDMPKGQAFMHRERSMENNALSHMFSKQLKRYDKLVRLGLIMPSYAPSVKEYFKFGGEVLMGHLRYGTSGAFNESALHPYFRRSNWPTRNLMICGNFNMTNTAQLNRLLIERGQHPIFDTDTQTVLEEIGFHLDEIHQTIYHEMRDKGLQGDDIQQVISERLDIAEVIRRSSGQWDGGYIIAGLIGNGDCFILRDPNGIRPGYFFEDDELFAFASERVPLMTVFDKEQAEVQEMPAGHLLTIKADGKSSFVRFAEPASISGCSFERIYFSRGNDPEIYRERKALGGALVPRLLDCVGHDLDHTVFSFIPNTAETAFYGMLASLRNHRRAIVRDAIWEAHEAGALTRERLSELVMTSWPRSEKVAHKDIKLRTFISQEKGRSKLVSHVYDITYGVINEQDTLVVVDDSIVRGTTLRESIIKILARTNPRKIIIASTAPQIRYPDCYGIDMSELGKFIAFQAAMSLLRDFGKKELITEIYSACCRELEKPPASQRNWVKEIYAPFTADEISQRIANLLRPPDISWTGELQIVYQGIDDLHRCLPGHRGDWYFTGNYPTPGGTVIANKSFVRFFEKKEGARVYDMDVWVNPLDSDD